MSRRSPWGWYEPAPKRPPPKRGIKMRKSGTTWWGRRWIDALEQLTGGYSNRLPRGRTYARAGRVHDLVVGPGEVTAEVTGSRAKPYEVRLKLAKLRDAVWSKAVESMAAKAQFTAELLAGEMPREIDAAFKEARASLFPSKGSDLRTACTCPDWENPCKHVAATHYVLGEAFDRDPFLLFELRGRTKEQVLEALRAARAGESRATRAVRGRGKSRSGAAQRVEPREDRDVASVRLGRLTRADYDKRREPLPVLHLSFETPAVSGALLRQLGAPPAWSRDVSPADLLEPVIRAAAEEARRLALAQPEGLVELPDVFFEPLPEGWTGEE